MFRKTGNNRLESDDGVIITIIPRGILATLVYEDGDAKYRVPAELLGGQAPFGFNEWQIVRAHPDGSTEEMPNHLQQRIARAIRNAFADIGIPVAVTWQGRAADRLFPDEEGL